MPLHSGLRYQVLGPLEVRRDDRAVDLGTPKQRAVLAALLLARGRVVSAERLLAVVWGEDLPASATATLQVYVSRLRSALRDEESGVSPLTRRAPGYVLAVGPGELDADDFLDGADLVRDHLAARDWSAALATAERSLDLWQGPLLDDLGDATWFRAEADVLEGRRVDVGCGLITAELGMGRTAEAAASAQRLTDQAPYRDELRRLQMLALHRAGRTADALDAYAAHAERLAEDLGIDPSADLRDLQVALLRQDPWADVWPLLEGEDSVSPAPVAPVASAGEPRAAAPLRPDDLVGREEEMRDGAALVDEVRAGATRALLLTGPPGIGKTRLAEEILAALGRAGGSVVRGRCLDEAGAPAWWPLRQIVRELGHEPDDVLHASGEAADTLRFEVYERLRELLERAARERPLGVLVDDVQWSDPTSAACLTYLLSSIRDVPLLLVVTVRDREGGDLARQTVTGLQRAGARTLVVPPLSVAAVAELAGSISGEVPSGADLELLTERTRGNALFVSEYAKLPAEERAGEVPVLVRAVLARRVEGLPDDVLRLLRLAAVIGDDLDLGLLAAVDGRARIDLVDLLDAAADAGIIVARASGYGFRHALVRDEVLSGLSAVGRQRLHAEVAASLATAGGELVTQRALHLLAAGPLAEPGELVAACRAAALQAEQRLSSETAVSWWERAYQALEHVPAGEQHPQERDDLMVARVEAMVRAGMGQSMLDVVDRELLNAVRLGRTSTAGRLAATLLRASGTWPWVTFGQDPGPLIARLTGTAADVAADSAARARVLAALAVGRCYDPDPVVPDRLSAEALELAEQVGDPEVLADAIIGRVITYVGEALHAPEAEELLDRLISLPRAHPDADAAFAHSARTMSRALVGDIAGVEEHVRLGIAGSDRLRLRTIRAQLRWMEVGITQWHDGPEAALGVLADAIATHRATELYDGGFGTLVEMSLLVDAERSEAIVPYDGIEGLTWAATRALAHGDRAAAERLARERLASPGPVIWMTLAHLVVLADVVVRLGVADLAETLEQRLAPYAGLVANLGQGPIMGPVDLARARLLRVAGREEEAVELARAALVQAERDRGRFWIERARAILATPVT